MTHTKKEYSKKELGSMLEGIFLQHPDQATFLILSDTNVFFDDPGGRKLATEHASKFNLRIFRFSNPVFAEGDQANAAIIEEGDEDEESGGEKAPVTATTKPEKEGEVTSEVSAQAAAEQKKAAATKASTKVTGSKTTSGGVKAKTR